MTAASGVWTFWRCPFVENSCRQLLSMTSPPGHRSLPPKEVSRSTKVFDNRLGRSAAHGGGRRPPLQPFPVPQDAQALLNTYRAGKPRSGAVPECALARLM